jgi:hypothetical protein
MGDDEIAAGPRKQRGSKVGWQLHGARQITTLAQDANARRSAARIGITSNQLRDPAAHAFESPRGQTQIDLAILQPGCSGLCPGEDTWKFG